MLHKFSTFPGILLMALIMFTGAAMGEETRNDKDDDIVRKAEQKYLDLSQNSEVMRYTGDTEIPEGERINGHVLVINGNLAIRGEVDGDVLVVWGNASIYNTGRVNGNATSVGGSVNVYDNGLVKGEMLETNVNNLIGKNRRITRLFRRSIKKDQYGTIPFAEEGDNLVFKYNRVEGVFLGLAAPKQFVPEFGHFSVYGFGGYGFKSRDWRFQLGIDRWFFSPIDYRFELGMEFHNLTDTKDRWRMPLLENTLAAMFLKEDFYDYFERKGFSFHAAQNITPYFRGKLEYRNDDYMSMPVETNWSLFGGDKRFRPNPPLDSAKTNMRSVYGELYWDNRDDVDFTTTGWYATLSAEVSSGDLGGDFSFDRYLLDVRHYQPVSTGENIDFRVMFGTSERDLPIQKNFVLGGISTLRGFRFNEFAGNSMFLLNVEYRIHSSVIGSDLPVLGDYFSVILFTDLGNAWQSPVSSSLTDRVKGLRMNNLKNDVGIAIAHPKGNYRLNIARRTDVGGNNFVVTFRISQPF